MFGFNWVDCWNMAGAGVQCVRCYVLSPKVLPTLSVQSVATTTAQWDRFVSALGDRGRMVCAVGVVTASEPRAWLIAFCAEAYEGGWQAGVFDSIWCVRLWGRSVVQTVCTLNFGL